MNRLTKKELEQITYDNLEGDRMYPVGVFRQVLGEKNLPSSMFVIMTWEKKGLIHSPRSNRNGWRTYTGNEIKELINKLSSRKEN